MKKIQSVVLLALLAALALAAKADCPAYPSCPLDGAQLMRVGTEYVGIKAVGIYSHRLMNGDEHKYRIACN